MEKLKGRIIEILEPEEGVTAKGKKWVSQKMIILCDDDQEYVCLNTSTQIIVKYSYKEGKNIETDYLIRSFKHAERWFTDVEWCKIEEIVEFSL
ncbi:MAG: DUF3127 domain-containing protein [Salinivirgaceae bacterium]